MKRTLLGLVIIVACISISGLAFASGSIGKFRLIRLGQLLFEDPNLSLNANQSCQTCHHPNASFSDPVNRIFPMYRPVSESSIAGLFDSRNTSSAA